MLLRALKVLMALCLVITCQCAWAFTDDPADDEYVSIAWRSIGSFSNREPYKELKVRSYVSKLDEPHVMDTGQAYQGWHEIHPDPGLVTATIYDKNQAYPVIADHIILKHER